MSPCDCNAPNGYGIDPETQQPLPSIEDQAALDAECAATGSWVEPCCANGDAVCSTTSTGTVLDSKLTDARCATSGEGITLLGRIGNVLAKFAGDGLLQIRSGKAYLVPTIPLVIRSLWHRYWLPAGRSVPIPGDPYDFPYGVVADKRGNLYGIQGLADKRALHVWSFVDRRWETISPDQFPIEVSRRLPQTNEVELVGFTPTSVIGDHATVRALKALAGHGVVYIERVPTAVDPENPCEEDTFSYVAKVLEFPNVVQSNGPETGRHGLVYSSLGLYWEAEAP